MRSHHLQTQYILLEESNYVTMATFSKYFFFFWYIITKEKYFHLYSNIPIFISYELA